METQDDYQGWKNYETWAVALWLDNDRASYEYCRDEARRHRRDAADCPQVKEGTWTPQEAARFNLADSLCERFAAGRTR